MLQVIGRYFEGQVQTAVATGGGMFRSRYGTALLVTVSFLESALPVPILTDPFLVAYILANRTKAVVGFVATTISSVVGGAAAYFTARYFFEFILSLVAPELVSEVHSMSLSADESTVLVTLVGALTPIPYTLTAWAVGLVEGSLLLFLVASTFGRGLRYAIVAYGAYRFGEFALARSRWYLIGVSIALLLVVVGYVVLKM